MKIIPRKSVGFCVSAALSCATVLMPSIGAGADDFRVSARELVVRLGAACGGDGEWHRSRGPSSALLRNSGDLSYARLYETGSYEFTASCCGTSVIPATTESNNLQESGESNNLQVSGLQRINSLMNSPDLVGFGAKTTGGAAAKNLTVVTNLNSSGTGSLREALRDVTPPVWITFANSIRGGTIYLNEPINVINSNVTLDGAGSDITISVRRNTAMPMLQFRGGNTIIHGVTIDGNRTDSTGLMIRERDNYWVDHVTVRNFNNDDGITVGQGTREDTSASEVTISNYHAHGTKYAMMAGGNDNVRFYPPHRVTIHSSILSADDRNPRIKNHGTAHLFNNYIHSQRFSGSNAGANSVIYSQNNAFSALEANNPGMALSGTTNNGGTVGRVYSSGDIFLDRAEYRGDVRKVSASTIRMPYRYTLKPAFQVIDHVNANAGAAFAEKSRNFKTGSVATNLVPKSAPASDCNVHSYSIDFVRR